VKSSARSAATACAVGLTVGNSAKSIGGGGACAPAVAAPKPIARIAGSANRIEKSPVELCCLYRQ
jgi:hypothetical protein